MNAEEMLDQLNIEGGECASTFNDGDLMGWFGWSIDNSDDSGQILTVTFETDDDDKVPTEHSWRLVPVS